MIDAAAAPARRRPRAARARAFLGRHRGLIALMVAAALVRVVALIAIYPGIWFSDSNGYIRTAATGTLNVIRASGYSLVVAPFWHLGSAGALIVAQHVMGVALVVALYALLLRRGVPRWLATLAVIPPALDAYLVSVEHAIMSDTVFHAALVGALLLVLWRDRLSVGMAAGAGLLLGYAAVVRTVGAPFVVVVVGYLLLRRAGWRQIAAFAAAWALVVVGYASVYRAQHDTFALTQWGGRFLYARTAPLADCARLGDLPASERALCPDPRRRLTVSQYLWGRSSPIHGLRPADDARIRRFALRVVREDPLRYAGVVARDVAQYFQPGRAVGPNDYSPAVWQFPVDPSRPRFPTYRGPIRPSAPGDDSVAPQPYVDAMVTRPRTNATASRALRAYQRVFYTQGPVLAICVLVVLMALASRSGAGRLRLDAAVLMAITVLGLFMACALSVFSYRYGLIAVVLLPAAAALAGAASTTIRDHARA